MATAKDIVNSKISEFVANAEVANRIVNGGITEMVQTAGGLVPSLAKVMYDLGTQSAEGNEEFLEALEASLTAAANVVVEELEVRVNEDADGILAGANAAASAASASAGSAGTAATAASGSESAASTSATAAETAKTLAQSWAVQLDTPVAGGEYSAKFHALAAAASAASIAAGPVYSINAMVGVVTIDKGTVGLSSVDDTADANKPVSTLQAAAIAAREPSIAAGSVAQYWRGDKSWQPLDKAAAGLPNVDNTSDANKPISTATQTALNGKQASLGFTPVQQGTGIGQAANVIKIGWSAGGRLKAAVDETDLGNVVFDSNLNKTAVGLPNVDNTSDANKPVSNATQSALNAKANLAGASFTGQVTSTAAGVAFVSTGYSVSGSTNFNNFLSINPTYGFVMSAQHVPGSLAQIEFQMGNTAVFRFGSTGTGSALGGWTTFSDARLKYDLQEITDALDKLDELVGYTYLRNDTSDEFGAHLKRHAGLLAQDARRVLPEAVGEASNGYLTLNYDAVIPLIVNALKALKGRVIALEKQA